MDGVREREREWDQLFRELWDLHIVLTSSNEIPCFFILFLLANRFEHHENSNLDHFMSLHGRFNQVNYICETYIFFKFL